MMIICGLFFTFLSLLVLGASTTSSESDATVTGGMAAHVMEKEEGKEGAAYKPVDIEDAEGKNVADEAHVFPISTATIIF